MRLLIIGAGIEQIRAYQLAKEMKHSVVGSDINPSAPAFKYADDCIIASTRDADETLRAVKEFHKRKPVDGVMTIANDVPLTVATIAHELGLAGISLESARLASDKLAMKRKFTKAGILTPRFRQINSVEDIKGTICDWGFPIVIKPINSRGARGVLRITPSIDLERAFQETLKHCDGQRTVLAEEYLYGRQISSETIVYKGECYTPMYSERNYEYLERFSPYIIENGGTLPADLRTDEIAAMDRTIEKVTKSMGITNGPVKGDIVLTAKGPAMLEMTARLGGGYACSHSIPLTKGVDIVKQTIKIALSEKIDIKELIPKNIQTAVLRYFFPEPGKIIAIYGFDELSKYNWVKHKGLYFNKGDVVPPVRDHTKRAGFVIVVGKDKQEAEYRAKFAIDLVKIETEPL